MASFPGSSDPEQLDFLVRAAAFEFLTQQVQLHGDSLPRRVLEKGFLYADFRVPLIGPQGIFKPAILETPISITTVPVVEGSPRPYEDDVSFDGLILYRYRGKEPQHPDNRGLRRAMERKIPLVYFYGTVPGCYVPSFPCYIVADNPRTLTFSVAVDDPKALLNTHSEARESAVDARRQYITVTTRQRLHQRSFRERVLRAYQEQCAICRLHHHELLEAAHILPDNHPQGEPTINNGIALCKIHHAAYDRHILGIRPDLVVELRMDILKEIDGPMLKYGLQEFHGASVNIPRKLGLRPNPKFLEERYAMFRAA